MQLVIVESPAKAKTINKYLGRGYEVIASFGHVRDLPPKDGSVDPDADFAMLWEVDGKAVKRMAEIAKAVKDSAGIILATDPDREGEAISWHVLEILKAKKLIKDKPVSRVVFNAITKDAILEAMRHPRAIDQALVDAYLARRALDYLVGFRLSPVLWRKLPGARSAGRVQSVALRLVCDREYEIETFVPREYWSLEALLKTKAGAEFTARLVGADGKKITRLDVGTEPEARALEAALNHATYTVTSVEAKPAKRYPAPPFMTSTLQQEASRKLGFAPARTMQLAQRLYEGVDIGGETTGLITYMRTDGVDMAPEAIAAARRVIAEDYGDSYVPNVPRRYTTKAKNAQEAHEAIRPTSLARRPKDVARYVEPDQAKLYELIFKRTLASQMESAEFMRTSVEIDAVAGSRVLNLRASGQVVVFDGFLAIYQEGRDDEADEDDARLPALNTGDVLAKERLMVEQHFTEPPPRFTEATLVKRMEELGIGRPSTYASTLAVLREREYVTIDKKRLVPQDKGRIVTAFLEAFFARYVHYDFTANLEEQLDLISNSELDWKAVLRDFWRDFSGAIDETKDLRTTQVLDALNDLLAPHIFPNKPELGEGHDPRSCPSCANGKLSLKLSKYGAFIGCTNYPDCAYTRQLGAGTQDGEGVTGADGDRPGVKTLGQHPQTGEEITLRDGRFGPYVQLGEAKAKDDKPKRSSLPRGLSPSDVTLEKALKLLALPREVAKHPETGAPIMASLGRYGPYVQHGKTYANLGRDDDVLEIGANRAIDLIVAKESGAPTQSRFGGGAPSGRLLGEHPEGGAVTLRDGRYGAYVNHGKINATLPKSIAKESVTLEEALSLIEAKEMAGGGGGSSARRGKKAAGKKAVMKKAGVKKTAVKKTAVKKIPAKAAHKAAPLKKAVAKKTVVKKVVVKKSVAKKAVVKKAVAKKSIAKKK